MKNQNFIVEVIKKDDSKIYVIRNIQNGAVIKVCDDSTALAEFFNDLKFES